MKRLFLAVLMTATVTLLAPSQPALAALPAAVNGTPVPTLAPMIKRVMPGVVNISTRGHMKVQQNPMFADPFFQQFFGHQMPQQPAERQFRSLGSGVIVNAEKGYILTNNHVIENADKISVTLNDNRSFDAKVVGKDPDTDLAVIQIKAKDLTAVPLGDSSQLQVGDFVVAIGNPFGLSHTATSGIVSALGRTGIHDGSYENFIQTDASINPGNSGGALVNLQGQLVGINSAILSKSGGNIGIGFAIPVDMARSVMEQIIKYGKVKRGLLGVTVQDLTPDLAKSFDIKQTEGAVVSQVMKDSAAEKAGVKQGDVIVSVDGKPVKTSSELRNDIGLMRPGEKVTLGIVRDGKQLEVTAKIGEKTEGEGTSVGGHEDLGARFSDLTPDSPLYGDVHGVVVTNVERDGKAAEAGLRPGDVITSVNRHPIRNLAEFRQALEHFKGTLLFTVRRGDNVFFTVIK